MNTHFSPCKKSKDVFCLAPITSTVAIVHFDGHDLFWVVEKHASLRVKVQFSHRQREKYANHLAE